MPSDSLPNGNIRGGVTERDAAHIRFREHGPTQVYRCSSCYESFKASNKAEIMEHFERNVHKTFASDCLYCQGAVYQYRTGTGETQFYHNCLPVKKENIERRDS